MGVPGAARIERMRQPTTISVSARCARISATDHLSGAGRLRSFEGGALFTRLSSFLGVADWVLKGSFPSIIFMMRWEYCCGVSLISSTFLGEDAKRFEKLQATQLLQNVLKSLLQRTVPGWSTALA